MYRRVIDKKRWQNSQQPRRVRCGQTKQQYRRIQRRKQTQDDIGAMSSVASKRSERYQASCRGSERRTPRVTGSCWRRNHSLRTRRAGRRRYARCSTSGAAPAPRTLRPPTSSPSMPRLPTIRLLLQPTLLPHLTWLVYHIYTIYHSHRRISSLITLKPDCILK
jgi:hypothetical protein